MEARKIILLLFFKRMIFTLTCSYETRCFRRCRIDRMSKTWPI